MGPSPTATASESQLAERSQLVPPLLLPEALGFSPQLLLDDIINIANNAVQDGVNGMEGFLQKWADERVARLGGEWDSTQEVEQGLVAFQTLLEYHTDVAFDFFEAWSLRNIFAIPPNLPIVLPHQEGLDLTQTPEREQELMDELEDLRKRIDEQRRTRRLYTRALRAASAQRTRAEKRVERLSFLESPTMDVLAGLPEKLTSMQQSVAALPHLDPATIAALTQLQIPEPGKRLWETNKTGYMTWAVSELVVRSRPESEGGVANVNELTRNVLAVGEAQNLRLAMEAMERVQADLQTVEPLADQSMDMDS